MAASGCIIRRMSFRSVVFPVLCLAAALPGCHAAGNSANRVDGAGGSGGGGANDGAAADWSGGIDGTGADRSGASDGAAADWSRGTDGTAVDCSDGAVGTEGAVPMTPTEVCQSAIKVQAERRSVCEGYLLEHLLDVANLCPDYYFNADSNRTVGDVAACLGPLAARTCTDVAINLLPSCLASGSRPTGAGCAYSSQCQSGMCGGTGEQCSTCRAGGIPVGSTCVGGDCQNGSFCHSKTGVCTAAATVVYATQGQPCDLAGTPVVGCVGDLLCVSSSSSTAGTCSPLPGVGQPCWTSNIGEMMCAAGATCTSLGVSGTGTCTLAACGAGPQCDVTSACVAGDGGFACVPLPTIGQPCGVLPCLPPGICMFSTGICAAPRASGETCDADNPCADLLSCVAGTCQPLGSENCPAGGGDGGTG